MIEYEPNAIVHSYITDYIRGELSENNALERSLEEYASKNDVPIIQPETAKLLVNICTLKKPKKVLEVGCAIGYSAILMSKAIAEDGKIITLEYDHATAELAKSNVKKAQLEDKITVVEADAKDYLSYIEEDECFDMIFMDGPKAHYYYMLDECVRLLKPGGVLISDNVLYKGMTATDELVQRRKITIVKRLRSFIHKLTHHPQLETAILSVGDGVTFSIKK